MLLFLLQTNKHDNFKNCLHIIQLTNMNKCKIIDIQTYIDVVPLLLKNEGTAHYTKLFTNVTKLSTNKT